jgi:hypothetical protein
MYKIAIKVVIAFGAVFLLSTIFYYENQHAFDSILIFLSITTGFSITALSIIATSKFSKELYENDSEEDNSLSLLHILVKKFEQSTITFVLTIILIIVYAFLDPIRISGLNIYGLELGLKPILSGTIWVFIVISFWHFLKLLNLFSKFVIRSAKFN